MRIWISATLLATLCSVAWVVFMVWSCHIAPTPQRPPPDLPSEEEASAAALQRLMDSGRLEIRTTVYGEDEEPLSLKEALLKMHGTPTRLVERWEYDDGRYFEWVQVDGGWKLRAQKQTAETVTVGEEDNPP